MGFLDERRCERCGKSEEYVHLEKHHRIKRSTGGTQEDEIDLCRTCHIWVELNPDKAEQMGLHIRDYKINRL